MNDDINDEFFKKAAEEYPLNTNNPDFDAVYKKMNPGTVVPEQQPRKKRRLLLLLLLLLLPVLVWVIIENRKAASHPRLAETQDSGPSAQKATVQKDKANIPAPATAAPVPAMPSAEQANNISSQAKPVAVPNNTTTSSFSAHRHTVKTFSAKNRFSSSVSNATADEEGSGIKTKRRTVRSKPASLSVSTKGEAADADDAFASAAPGVVSSGNPKTASEAETAIAKTADQPGESSVKPNLTTAPKDSAKSLAETKEKDPVSAKDQKKTPGKSNKPSKHFYAGIIAGPDFTSIKLQAVKKVGFSYGFTAGYKISNRFSIETGLLKEKKYYSTDGKYFNTGKLNLPDNNIKILYAKGSCDMLELPLNINYIVRQRPHSYWYISAGFSSYFMKNESYDYDISYYNYRYARSWDYSSVYKSFFSAANIGAGYMHRFGRIGELGLAPYIKIPVKKIGTGSLSLESAGIQLRFTKSVF